MPWPSSPAVTLALATLTACRIGFDPLGVQGDASSDVLDNAGGDGMPPDTSGTDACALASTFVCDPFETGLGANFTIGAATWLAGGGRDGGGALRASGTGALPALAGYTWAPPITDGRLHTRVYARLGAGAPIASYAALIQVDNGVATMGQEKISADLRSADRYSVAVPFAIGGNSPGVAPRETWMCLELAVLVDATGTSGTVQWFVDDVEVIGIGPQLTMVPGGFVQLYLGASLGATDPDLEVLYDDLVVAHEPIGC